MSERAGLELSPRRDVVMLHVCLVIGQDRTPIGVSVTDNPLEHAAYAQVVMHKTRSRACAMQVARYVRRTFDVEEPVTAHRSNRKVEAMIGYACAGGRQHAPNERTPGWGVFQHIAMTPISKLLEEVRGGHNSASTRYVVYEVRCNGEPSHRGVTNKYHALERRYREAPPDALVSPDVVVVGSHATSEDAEARVAGWHRAGDHLWTRRPPVEYVRRVLRFNDSGDVVWTCDGASAVRRYDFDAVVIGPHVYTLFQVRWVLQHGEWVDRRTTAGRKLVLDGMG